MPTVLKVTTKIIGTSETKCTCGFRGGDKKNHKGVDLIPKSTAETPDIHAYDDGTVIQVQNFSGTTDSVKNPGMGTSVALKHADGTVTRYQHLKYNSLCVKKGDKVKKGQKLGVYGRPTTGNSTGPHLHFDISLPKKPKVDCIEGSFCSEKRYYVDPVPYLTKKTAPTYTVTASALRVRAGAGTSYAVVEIIHRGTEVTVTEQKNGFGKIADGRWCSMEYLKKV